MTRLLAPLALGFALTFTSAPALAQQPDPSADGGGEKDTGRPFDGYFATSILAGLILFAVAKSARR